jgi:hypothetical protein
VAEEAANPRYLASTLQTGLDPGELKPAIRFHPHRLANQHSGIFIGPSIALSLEAVFHGLDSVIQAKNPVGPEKRSVQRDLLTASL